MKPTAATGKRKERLVEICRQLPKAEAAVVGLKGEHLQLKVRGKTFGYYAYDHHGDGRIALHCKAAPGEQGRLVEEDPKRFFVPPYLGKNGWVAVRLDLAKVNWSEIAYLLRTAYRLTAPRKLVAGLDDPPRSVVGTVTIDPSDPMLDRADEAVGELFAASVARPLGLSERRAGNRAHPARRRRRG